MVASTGNVAGTPGHGAAATAVGPGRRIGSAPAPFGTPMRRLSGRPWPIWRKSRTARSIVERIVAFMLVVSRTSSSPFIACVMAVNVPESTTSMMPIEIITSGSEKPASDRVRVVIGVSVPAGRPSRERGDVGHERVAAGRRAHDVAHRHLNLPQVGVDVADGDFAPELVEGDIVVAGRRDGRRRTGLELAVGSGQLLGTGGSVVRRVDQTVGAGLPQRLLAVEEDA